MHDLKHKKHIRGQEICDKKGTFDLFQDFEDDEWLR